MNAPVQPRASVQEVGAWAREVLRALGCIPRNTAIVAESLLDADLRGYPGHGVARLVDYADAVRDGRVDPAAVPVTLPPTAAAVGSVDGREGFGHVTALHGVELVAELASTTGIAAVSLRNCHHVGRLGRWVDLLAQRGLIGHAMSQGEPWVAAPGARQRLLGTNPFAYGLPARVGPPVIVDFATSATSVGAVAVAAREGRALAEGILLDAEGEPTTEPSALFAGGMLAPLAAHKGFGMSLVADLWAGAAGGDGPASAPGHEGHHGVLLIAADPALWGGLVRLPDDVETVRGILRDSRTDGDEPRMPGERSAQSLRTNTADGIAFDPVGLSRLDDLSRHLGVGLLSARLRPPIREREGA